MSKELQLTAAAGYYWNQNMYLMKKKKNGGSEWDGLTPKEPSWKQGSTTFLQSKFENNESDSNGGLNNMLLVRIKPLIIAGYHYGEGLE